MSGRAKPRPRRDWPEYPSSKDWIAWRSQAKLRLDACLRSARGARTKTTRPRDAASYRSRTPAPRCEAAHPASYQCMRLVQLDVVRPRQLLVWGIGHPAPDGNAGCPRPCSRALTRAGLRSPRANTVSSARGADHDAKPRPGQRTRAWSATRRSSPAGVGRILSACHRRLPPGSLNPFMPVRSPRRGVLPIR